MISFISTFPPIICGIGTYTRYVSTHIPKRQWRVLSFNLDEFSISNDALTPDLKAQVDYCLSLPFPSLPPVSRKELLWFQHSFGIWGEGDDNFLCLLEQARKRGNRTVASFHTIHFQSEETPWGMCRNEEEVLRETLPLVDALTVFTDGAYGAVTSAFPAYSEKVAVLRHGVHLYPELNPHEARRELLSFLMNDVAIPSFQKRELQRAEPSFHSKDSILIGNYGFITHDKALFRLYELGKLIQERLPGHRVITLFAGIIPKANDNTLHERTEALEDLRSRHDGKNNFFFEVYVPEELFPAAFRALDFAVFWCNNATQSGRLAHAQGTGVSVVGRDFEGVGETLRLSGLPAARSLDKLAETVAGLILEPGMKREIEAQSWQYARRFSFRNQAQKHLLIEKALSRGVPLPALDARAVVQPVNRKSAAPYKSYHLGRAALKTPQGAFSGGR